MQRRGAAAWVLATLGMLGAAVSRGGEAGTGRPRRDRRGAERRRLPAGRQGPAGDGRRGGNRVRRPRPLQRRALLRQLRPLVARPGQDDVCSRAERSCASSTCGRGTVRVLVDDPQGSVRDPCVHYDGGKILFSYRPGGTRYFHLYEIGADGTGLRQLTDGPFDDIEPAYLPDGDIIFPSSRCKRFVACWYTPVATLHRMDRAGQHPLPVVEHRAREHARRSCRTAACCTRGGSTWTAPRRSSTACGP